MGIEEQQENVPDAKRIKLDKDTTNNTPSKMGPLPEVTTMETESSIIIPTEMETELTNAPTDSNEIISEDDLAIALKVLQKLKDKEVDIKEKRFRPIRVLL